MARLYAAAPSAEELGAIGITAEDVADTSEVEVWKENWLPFLIFNKLRTQWRVGMAGCTGMDYQTLPMLFAFHGVVTPKAQAKVYAALQFMEFEALRLMQERNKT